jgi:hypothetical protein
LMRARTACARPSTLKSSFQIKYFESRKYTNYMVLTLTMKSNQLLRINISYKGKMAMVSRSARLKISASQDQRVSRRDKQNTSIAGDDANSLAIEVVFVPSLGISRSAIGLS